MILEIIPEGGITRVEPIRIAASQVLITREDGTVIALAAVYGADGSILVSRADDDDFNTNLRQLGVGRTTICDRLEIPRLPGARLIAGPSIRSNPSGGPS